MKWMKRLRNRLGDGRDSGKASLPADVRFPVFQSGRPAVLFIVPWMAPGGAEQVVFQVMRGLAPEFELAIVSTLADRHEWEPEFRSLTPWVYHLADLKPSSASRFFRDFVSQTGVRAVIVSWSKAGYESLPQLRKVPGLWIADIIHNTVKEGHLQASLEFDRYVDLHFAVGEMQSLTLETRGSVPKARIRLAPTSADTQGRFHPERYKPLLGEIRQGLGLADEEIVLTYVGRLSPEKDVPLFVEIVAEIARRHPEKRIRGLIAGDGPDRARVEQTVESLRLKGVVRILGFSQSVPEILAVSNYVILPSQFEGSSITLLEAMSMECVVMATDVGAVREVIQHGVNGFIATTRNPAEFADRFDELLKDAGWERRVMKAARQTIVERFDLAAMVRIYAEALRAGLASKAPASR